MDLGTLKVGIGADLTAFSRGVAQIESQIAQVQRAVQPVAAAFAPVEQAAKRAGTAIKGSVEKAAEDAAKAAEKAAAKAAKEIEKAAKAAEKAAQQQAKEAEKAAQEAEKAAERKASAEEKAAQRASAAAEKAAREQAKAAERAAQEQAKAAERAARETERAAQEAAKAAEQAATKAAKEAQAALEAPAKEARKIREQIRQQVGGEALNANLGRVGNLLREVGSSGPQNGVSGATALGHALEGGGQVLQGFMSGGVIGLAVSGVSLAIEGVIGAYKELKQDQQDVIDAARDGHHAIAQQIQAQVDALRDARLQLDAYHASLKSGLSVGGETRKAQMEGADKMATAAQATVDRLTPIMEGMDKRLGGLNKDSPMIPTDIKNEGLIGQRDSLKGMITGQKELATLYKATADALRPLVQAEQEQHDKQAGLTDLHTRIKRLVEQAQDSGSVGVFAAKLKEITGAAGDISKLNLNPDELKAFNEEIRELKRSMAEQRYQVLAHDLQQGGTKALHKAEDAGTSGAYAEAIDQLKAIAEQFQKSGATQAAKKAFRESSDETIRGATSQQFDKLAQELLKRAEPLKLLAERQGNAHVDQYLINLLQELKTIFARSGATEAQRKAFNGQVDSEIRGAQGKLSADIAAGIQRQLQQIADEVRRGSSSQLHALYQSNALSDEATRSTKLNPNEKREVTRAADNQSFDALSTMGSKLGAELQTLRSNLEGIHLGPDANHKETMSSLGGAQTVLTDLQQRFAGLADLAGGVDKLPGGAEYKYQLDQLGRQIQWDQAYQAAHRFSDDLEGSLLRLGAAIREATTDGPGGLKGMLGSIFGALGGVGTQLLGASGPIGTAIKGIVSAISGKGKEEAPGEASNPSLAHVDQAVDHSADALEAHAQAVQAAADEITQAAQGGSGMPDLANIFAGATDALDEVAAKVEEAAASLDASARSGEGGGTSTVSTGGGDSDAASSDAGGGDSSSGTKIPISGLGGAGQVAQGATTGGVPGAIIAFAMQSSEAKYIINMVNKSLSTVASALGKLIGYLAPVIDIVLEMVEVIAEFVGIIEGAFKPVFELVFYVMKGVATIIIYIVSAIQFAWENAVNAVLEALASIVGVFSDSWAADVRGWEYQNASWKEILDKNKAGLDSIDFNRDSEAAENFGNSLNAATNALNAFSGYRVEGAYYENMGAYGSPTPLRAHASGGTVVGIANGLAVTAAPGEGLVSIGQNESIVHNDDLQGRVPAAGSITYVTIEQVILDGAKDARALWEELKALMRGETVAQIGSEVPGGPRYTGNS